MTITEQKAEAAVLKIESDDAAAAAKAVADEGKTEEELQAEADKAEADAKDTAKDDDTTDDVKDADKEKKVKEDEGEFTADDALEIEEAKPAVAPSTDASGVQLSTAERTYISENIGEPITIRGMIGDKATEIKVYAPDQIPRDFTFNSQGELLTAQASMSRLENKAEQLLGGYRNQQSQQQATDFETRENEGIRQDVAELQKDGVFAKFKVQPGSKDFESDPAAVQMTEVLAIMTKRNEQYIAEYNQGRPYKHIGFKEAFEIYSKAEAPKAKVIQQKKEDADRKEVADKTSTNRGMVADKLSKARVRPGTTVGNILDRIDSEDW